MIDLGSELPLDGPWVEAWLSTPRFAVYVHAADDDRERALRLYEWNSRLSAGIMHDLAHIEVAIRNYYDSTLSQTWSGRKHWLLDPQGPMRAPLWRTKRTRQGKRRVDVNERPRRLIEEACRRCCSSAPPGKIIAELPFGFWRFMSSSAHEKTLWVPMLYKSFPPGVKRADVDGVMGRLNDLRNRAAHHEPVFSEPITDRLADLFWLSNLLSPQLSRYIRVTSTVAELLEDRP